MFLSRIQGLHNSVARSGLSSQELTSLRLNSTEEMSEVVSTAETSTSTKSFLHAFAATRYSLLYFILIEIMKKIVHQQLNNPLINCIILQVISRLLLASTEEAIKMAKDILKSVEKSKDQVLINNGTPFYLANARKSWQTFCW